MQSECWCLTCVAVSGERSYGSISRGKLGKNLTSLPEIQVVALEGWKVQNDHDGAPSFAFSIKGNRVFDISDCDISLELPQFNEIERPYKSAHLAQTWPPLFAVSGDKKRIYHSRHPFA